MVSLKRSGVNDRLRVSPTGRFYLMRETITADSPTVILFVYYTKDS